MMRAAGPRGRNRPVWRACARGLAEGLAAPWQSAGVRAWLAAAVRSARASGGVGPLVRGRPGTRHCPARALRHTVPGAYLAAPQFLALHNALTLFQPAQHRRVPLHRRQSDEPITGRPIGQAARGNAAGPVHHQLCCHERHGVVSRALPDHKIPALKRFQLTTNRSRRLDLHGA